MRSKLFWTLILIVLLPLSVLAWQSWQIGRDDAKLQQLQQGELIKTLLAQVDSDLQSQFSELATQWRLQIPQWALSTNALREIVQQDGRIQQILVLTPQWQRAFPPSDTMLTAAEQAFVVRMENVWRDPNRLFNSMREYKAEAIQQQASSSMVNRVTKAKVSAPTPNQREGWFMWHWESGLNILYWLEKKSGEVIGIELNMARLTSDLINRLPATARGENEDFQLQLLDMAGQVLYQWGNYQTQEAALLQQNLSYPLANWSLAYYGSFTTSARPAFTLWLSFTGFTGILLGLAYFLYREQTRELRLAAQRVQFVSQVSHELKTPLTNIRMYAEMLEDQLMDEPQQQHYLQVITGESQRLSRLITNVLNFSHRPQLHSRATVVDKVIERALAHFRLSFAGKGLQLQAQLQAKQAIQCDPDALEQILTNLLSNAEKYAVSGKRVDIRSEQNTEQVRITVRDYGVGIPRREAKRIFQAFYRIHENLTEGVSGTGIGLTIARQQAELLGGRLWLANITPGACFILEVPNENFNRGR